MSDATEFSAVNFAFYRYDPSMGAAVLFILLFTATTGYHAFQMTRTRTWFMIPFILGGIFETIGYIGRAASSQQSPNWTLGPYIVQTLFLLLAPALLAASIYMLLGRIILIMKAESYALLKKKWLTKIFVTGDVLSFLLQGAGGGIQSSGNMTTYRTGEHIIVFGLIIQILFFGVFKVIASHFYWNINRSRAYGHDIPWRKYLHVLYATSFLIMVRSIFRLAEYLQGNDGVLLQHEVFLYLFDAVLMLGTMLVFNVVHPGGIVEGFRGGLVAGDEFVALK
ncbi:RTA1 domain-containing protein [Aspergillus homomorphus CBS 101889]|uniref:RTA1-domain-containing protein n=1 Tax=Aspergillus homomorphus (strain CBS 101889) TaxID=1450537 RepID=A0A395HPC3_ASPHC|nr:RTA1-domain-containing protein [Aspergillus homomorphus CBS 101889]RAL09273.1 RTA1-domain-containing protein [Aspergillus homomorphus CBS 101889]